MLEAYNGKKQSQRGFTLVELIVVLVILAVLAALLVPSLTGYIDKAKKKAVITEARDVWTASQAALSECYALYPESFTANSANNKSNCRFSVCINNKWVDNVGKISNAALNALQKEPKRIRWKRGRQAAEFPPWCWRIWTVQTKTMRAIHFTMARQSPKIQSQVRILIKHQSPPT